MEALSPELVLVSPPEVASLARAQLPTMAWWQAVPSEPREPVSSRAKRREFMGTGGFAAFCALNSLVPLVLVLGVRGYF